VPGRIRPLETVSPPKRGNSTRHLEVLAGADPPTSPACCCRNVERPIHQYGGIAGAPAGLT
jgi:hypothetical protein